MHNASGFISCFLNYHFFGSCCLQHSNCTVELHIWTCIWESVEAKAIRGDGWTLKHQDLGVGKLFLVSMFFLCIFCWSFALMPLSVCALCLWMILVCVLCLVHLSLCFVAFCVTSFWFVLWAFVLCILCYELLKRRLQVVSFWFVLWAFGIWTFCIMNSQRRDFKVSKGVGVWVVQGLGFPHSTTF